MASFLFKTEPGDYSFSDLVRDGTCVWTGVANPVARAHLRAVRKGDAIFVYHTGEERAIVGLAKATGDAYADPKSPGVNDAGEPTAPVVDLAPVKALKTPVALSQVKADPGFSKFLLVTHGRLSVIPVSPEHDKAIRALAGL
jgi:predicted RNA-binding protein with PUA-like domain